MKKTTISAYITVMVSLILITGSSGQKLRIIDDETKVPVADVYVFNEMQNVTAFSNSAGIIDLAGFPESGSLFFQHPAYETREYSWEQLVSSGFNVTLSEKIISFDEIVVSANKWQQSHREVAQDIRVLNSKTIEFSNPQTSADILSNSGQVFVQKSQYGGGSPTLRGFAANKVLLVIDGVRLNNGIYRSGNLQNVINIDANAVQQTEIAFGPGSVMYGSDALGGVVDFTMLSPEYSFEDKPLIKGSFLVRGASAAQERTVHTDLGIGWKNVSYWSSVSHSNLGDLKAGSRRSEAYEGYFERDFYVQRVNGQDQLTANNYINLQKFSGYNLTNVIQKLSARLGSYSELNYGYYFSTTTDIPRYDRLTIPLAVGSDSLEFAEWYYGPQVWSMHRLGWSHFKTNPAYDQMKFIVSIQDYEESRNDRRFGDDRLRTRTEQVDILTASLDFEKDLSKGSTLFYGIDGFHNKVNSSGFRRNLLSNEISVTTPRYPDEGSTYSSLAFYSSIKVNAGQYWKFNFGVRFNNVWLKANTSDESASTLGISNVDISNQALTGSAAVIYTPTETSKLSFLVSSGFRSPNIDDVGKLFELDDEVIVIPNPDLKPEYVYNQEFAYQQKLNAVTQLDFVIYHSFLTSAIVREEFALAESETITLDENEFSIRAQVNSSRARIYGSSLRFKGKLLNNLAMISSINLNEGRDLDNDEPLRHSTPVFGQTELRLSQGELTLKMIGTYNFKRSRSQIPSAEIDDKSHLYTLEGSPGWFTLDLRAGYRFDWGLDLESGVENMFDQHYRPYSSGISAPGRNVYFTARYKF